MKCVVCGKEFFPGNRPDGIPNGVGFISPTGKMVDICAECVIRTNTDPEVMTKLKKAMEGEPS